MNVVTPKFIFNETQRAPMLHQQGVNVNCKLTELALCINENNKRVIENGAKESLEIHKTQEKILEAITALSVEFARVDLSVKEIQEKLTQYDLDAEPEEADEADEAEEEVKPKRKYTRKPKK